MTPGFSDRNGDTHIMATLGLHQYRLEYQQTAIYKHLQILVQVDPVPVVATNSDLNDVSSPLTR